MPFEYTSDEQHFAEWIEAEKSPAALEAFLDRYIYGTHDFEEYLALCGGDQRLADLRDQEPLKRG
jgi:3-oxoacid CoA-transferase subunit A/glutaconate CoA-transferase subunit A